MYIVAFEGIDASGKETQVKLLCEALQNKGYKVCTESFPRYNSRIGALLSAWLRDEISLTDEAAHILFEADRQDFMRDVEALSEVYDFLILDRYTLSNLAFGMAKGMDLAWLASLQEMVSKPDLTFVLDISAETSYKRKPEHRDKYENNDQLQNRTRAAYRFLGEHLAETEGQLIHVIDADNPPQLVHEEVLSYLSLLFFHKDA